jgi:hypothetical protein
VAREVTGNPASAEIVRDGGMNDVQITDALQQLQTDYEVE